MSAAAMPMPGQGAKSVQEAFGKFPALLSNIGDFDPMKVHSAYQQVANQRRQTEQSKQTSQQAAGTSEPGILVKFWEWLKEVFTKIVNTLRRMLGMEEIDPNQDKDAQRAKAKGDVPGVEQNLVGDADVPADEAAEDVQAEVDGSNPTDKIRTGDEHINTADLREKSDANIAPFAAPAPGGEKDITPGAGPGGAPLGLSNDWVVEDGEKKASKPPYDIHDLMDVDFQELDEKPIGDGYALAPTNTQADLAAKALSAIHDSMRKTLDMPGVADRVREAAAGDDPQAMRDAMINILLEPSLEDIKKQVEVLEGGLGDDLKVAIKDDLPDESVVEVTVGALVSGLPVNIASQMLPPETAERVSEIFEKRVVDIEKLSSLKATLGASASLFEGTFDHLKEKQVGDRSVFDPSNFKLNGKVDEADKFEEFKMERPRA